MGNFLGLVKHTSQLQDKLCIAYQRVNQLHTIMVIRYQGNITNKYIIWLKFIATDTQPNKPLC
jgi:hypothetical protein